MINFIKDHAWILILILAIGLVPYSLITQNELNLRTLMTAVAIDKTEDKYKITAQIVLSGDSGGQGSEQMEFFSIESNTIADGLRNITIEIGKTLGLSQIDYLLLGESMLDSKNVFSEIDFFIRTRRISNSMPVFFCEGSAEEMIKKTKSLDIEMAVGLQKLFLFKQEASLGYSSSIYEILNESKTHSKTALVSGIEIDDEPGEKKEEGGGGEGGSEGAMLGGESGGSSPGGSSQTKKGVLKTYSDLYIFKENKYIGKITDTDQKLGIYMLNRHSNEITLSVENINGDIFTDAKASLELREKKLKIRPSFENGKPIITIKMKYSNNNVNEIINNNPNASIHSSVKQYLCPSVQEATKKKIAKCITSAFDDTKDTCDVFQFENCFYKYKTKDYKFYKNVYGEDFVKNIELRFDITISERS